MLWMFCRACDLAAPRWKNGSIFGSLWALVCGNEGSSPPHPTPVVNDNITRSTSSPSHTSQIYWQPTTQTVPPTTPPHPPTPLHSVTPQPSTYLNVKPELFCSPLSSGHLLAPSLLFTCSQFEPPPNLRSIHGRLLCPPPISQFLGLHSLHHPHNIFDLADFYTVDQEEKGGQICENAQLRLKTNVYPKNLKRTNK